MRLVPCPGWQGFDLAWPPNYPLFFSLLSWPHWGRLQTGTSSDALMLPITTIDWTVGVAGVLFQYCPSCANSHKLLYPSIWLPSLGSFSLHRWWSFVWNRPVVCRCSGARLDNFVLPWFYTFLATLDGHFCPVFINKSTQAWFTLVGFLLKASWVSGLDSPHWSGREALPSWLSKTGRSSLLLSTKPDVTHN